MQDNTSLGSNSFLSEIPVITGEAWYLSSPKYSAKAIFSVLYRGSSKGTAQFRGAPHFGLPAPGARAGYIVYPEYQAKVTKATKAPTIANECQATNKRTSSSSSDSSSTVDTLSSEGEDEKDFILPDHPSGELRSSDSSDKNLSIGWSEKVSRVDTQFLQDHIAPKTSETTSATKAPRTKQVKQSKPTSYYAKNFKPVSFP